MKTRHGFALMVCAVLIPGIATAAVPVKKAARSTGLDTSDDPALPIPVIPVTVQNFPSVQAVGGTVSVDNLPSVQQVSGTVSVGNLPLTDDGNVRVSLAPGASREPAVYELLSAPLTISGATSPIDLPTVIDTKGYSSFGVYVRAGSTDWGDSATAVSALWRWSDDESFTSVADLRGGSQLPPCPGVFNTHYLCPNPGGFLQIRLSQSGPANTVYSVRVYLFP
jgi:hypothetical protein